MVLVFLFWVVVVGVVCSFSGLQRLNKDLQGLEPGFSH